MSQDYSTGSTVSLTPDALKEMIAAAVTAAIIESRKPDPPTAKELAEQTMKQEQRARNAAETVRMEANKRANQLICSHEHNNGDTHCVWVREENPASPGFILCQRQQCRIRPGEFTQDYKQPAFLRDRGAIYDTNLFNRLFQKCAIRADME